MYPPKPFETSVAAFVGDVGKYRLSTTPISEKCAFSREFSLPAMPCSRGFRPLFTRSIKAHIRSVRGQEALLAAFMEELDKLLVERRDL